MTVQVRFPVFTERGRRFAQTDSPTIVGTPGKYLAFDGDGVAIDAEPPTAEVAGAALSTLAFDQAARRIAVKSLVPETFDAVGDGVTDDGPAFLAAIAHLNAHGGKLHIPAKSYYLGTSTLDITNAVRIEGEGNGMVGGAPSILRWADGVTGIRLQRSNTEGDHQPGGTGNGADGSVIKGLLLKSAGTANGTAHAVDAMCRFKLEDVVCYQWSGNGINIVATAGGGAGTEGNANGFAVTHCAAYGCKNGLYVAGADANAGVVTNLDASQNRGWGIYDESLLGNTYVACHTAGNASGPYKTTNDNSQTVLTGCYSEGDQSPSSLRPTTLVQGGQHGAGLGSTGFRFYGDGNFRGYLSAPSGMIAIAPSSGFSLLALPASTAAIYFGGYAYNDCEFQVSGNGGAGGYYNVQTGKNHSLCVNTAEVAKVDGNGLALASGKTLNFVSLTNAANDTAAASAGVPLGSVYRNGSALMVRVA